MVSSPKLYLILVLLVLISGLTGCALPRNSNENADASPVEALPPTLAPLGTESDEMAAEATPIPTIINVQPTGTLSPLSQGEAAPSPNEIIPPTAQPESLLATPAASNQGEQPGAAPDTLVAPSAQEQPASNEPVVVDAAEGETASIGPVAANPPVSETTGDYGPTYGDTTYTVQPGDTLFGISQRYGTTVEAIAYANGLTSDLVIIGQTLNIPAGDGSGYYPPASGPAVMGGNAGAHVVVPGDTLFSIALRYGSSVEAIASANGISYPYIIFDGQTLVIPAGGNYPGPAQPPVQGYYPPNQYPAPDPNSGGYYQPPYPVPDPNSGGYYPQPYPVPDPNSGGYYPQPYPVPDPNSGGYYPQPYPVPDPNNGYYPQPGNENMMPGQGGTHTVAPGETLNSIARRYGTSTEALARANGLINPNQIYVGQVLYLP